ncbi:helix-turn-helix domain-containing protein [[Bacillus] enclensis]|uniref:helix-turn-helix domain-containing protein n=1 Tax=[Bacillus] enclensis TaxID=1402860 RepID=UPI0018DD1D8E|nr:helix-turn-helix domain-containing protein [[Bacillus] enclensis]MBH9965576.1 helix-turn-helix domain-containing protein [[Bacillus] enclensis]
MQLSCESTYRNLSTFESVDQLNESARSHARQLTGTEAAVFDVLSRHSCKYPGVSFLTKTNIGKLIGKCRRTIIRVCQRLEELGMIRQYELRRQSDGQQTSNAIVILPVKSADVGENVAPVTQDVTPLSPSSNHNSKALLHNTSTSPYVRFKQLIADKKVRNKIYGIWLAHTSYLKGAYSDSVLLNVGITAAMTAFKSTGVRNIVGYYNGVLDKMLDKLYFSEVVTGDFAD